MSQEIKHLIENFVQELVTVIVEHLRGTLRLPPPASEITPTARKRKVKKQTSPPVAPVPLTAEKKDVELERLETAIGTWLSGLDERPSYIQAKDVVASIGDIGSMADIGLVLRRLGYERTRIHIDGVRMRAFVLPPLKGK